VKLVSVSDYLKQFYPPPGTRRGDDWPWILNYNWWQLGDVIRSGCSTEAEYVAYCDRCITEAMGR
jgi:hypothetical protein